MNNIILQGFEPLDLISNFSQGKEPFMVKTPARIIIDDKPSIFDSVLTKTISDKNTDIIYEYREDQGRKVQVHTTQGNLLVEMMNTNGQMLPMGGVCMYHCLPFEGQSYGYPLRVEEIAFKAPNENGELCHYYKHVFHVEGMFCGFPCALAYLNQFLSGRSHNCSIKVQARMLLLQHFSMLYPGQKLKESRDRLLLRHFGGHMEFDEWITGTFTLIPMHHIVYAPAKTAYMKIDERKERSSAPRVSAGRTALTNKLQANRPALKVGNNNGGQQFNRLNLFTLN